MKNKIINSIKLLISTIICIGIIIALFVGVFIYSHNALPKEHKLYRYPFNQYQDDTIRIAYIGDSWAEMHSKHICKIPQIITDSLRRPVEIYTFGIGGRTSKEIYEDIFNNSDFNIFLNNRKYNYCIISLGINDAYKKKRIKYYQQSMYYIAKHFIANNIHPIIIEIPEIDIEYSYKSIDLSRKILYTLSMFLYKIHFNDKQQYRDALDRMIIQKSLSNKVSIIRYKTWNNNGEKDFETLYLDDRMHLNEMGYAKLDSCISMTCLQLEQ